MKFNFKAAILAAVMAASDLLSACGAESGGGTVSPSEEENREMSREIINFNTGWLYSPNDYENGSVRELDDSGFEEVSLPHANTLLTKHKGPGFPDEIQSYQFVSWYRRHFILGKEYDGKRIAV